MSQNFSHQVLKEATMLIEVFIPASGIFPIHDSKVRVPHGLTEGELVAHVSKIQQFSSCEGFKIGRTFGN